MTTATAPVEQQSRAAAVRSKKKLILKGLYPATITPFAADMSVDFPALERHLRETCEAKGVSGIAVNGGLGEILQLSVEEQVEVIKLTARVRKPGQLLIAGLEGRSARAAIETGKALKAAGAEAFLVFPPFDVRAYKRLAAAPSQVYAFFEKLDRELDVPMVVFQYPPQTGLSYPIEALKQIATLPNVVSIKAASGTVETYRELWDAMNGELSIMAAVDSPPLLPMLEHGAHGALIGISAIVPAKWAELLEAVETGDKARSHAIFEKICKPLMASVFENQQPKRLTNEAAAVKEALVQLGSLASSRVREPAVGVDDDVRRDIRQSLIAAELIKP